jgi:microcystin-dependent protein
VADPYLGEIRIFAGNFAPVNWAVCNGQLLSIAQNTALFSILGTYYGGDGRTTFGLPNFQGTVPMHQGTGNGLTPRSIGDTGGETSVGLNTSQLAAHTHTLQGTSTAGGTTDPTNALPAEPAATREGGVMYTPTGSPGAMNTAALAPTGGGGVPHNNIQPTLPVTFIICLVGIYPPRS